MFEPRLDGPTQNLGPIRSAVLTFIGYKKQTDWQTTQAKYIYRCFNSVFKSWIIRVTIYLRFVSIWSRVEVSSDQPAGQTYHQAGDLIHLLDKDPDLVDLHLLSNLPQLSEDILSNLVIQPHGLPTQS